MILLLLCAYFVATISASTPRFPRMAGLNFAGFEFGIDGNGQASSGSYIPFDNSQFKHFANQSSKVNLARIPIGWNHLEPTLGGSFNPTVLSQYQASVQAALDQNMYVIIDLHNYGRRDGGIINENGGPTAKQFANTWSNIVKTFNNSKMIYGIMNEPHDLDMSCWLGAIQAAVDAIRDAGAKDNLILLPGSSWTGIQALSSFAPLELNIKDKAHPNDPRRLLIEGHRYLDTIGAGNSPICVDSRTLEIQAYAKFLKLNRRFGLLTEIGASYDESCQMYFPETLKAINSAYPNILGFAVWAAGSFKSLKDNPNGGYLLSLTPSSDGSDQDIWKNVILPAIKNKTSSTHSFSKQ